LLKSSYSHFDTIWYRHTLQPRLVIYILEFRFMLISISSTLFICKVCGLPVYFMERSINVPFYTWISNILIFLDIREFWIWLVLLMTCFLWLMMLRKSSKIIKHIIAGLNGKLYLTRQFLNVIFLFVIIKYKFSVISCFNAIYSVQYILKWVWILYTLRLRGKTTKRNCWNYSGYIRIFDELYFQRLIVE